MTSRILLRVCSDYPVTNDYTGHPHCDGTVPSCSILLIILSAGVNNTEPKDASSSLKTPEIALKIKWCILFRYIFLEKQL